MTLKTVLATLVTLKHNDFHSFLVVFFLVRCVQVLWDQLVIYNLHIVRHSRVCMAAIVSKDGTDFTVIAREHLLLVLHAAKVNIILFLYIFFYISKLYDIKKSAFSCYLYKMYLFQYQNKKNVQDFSPGVCIYTKNKTVFIVLRKCFSWKITISEYCFRSSYSFDKN